MIREQDEGEVRAFLDHHATLQGERMAWEADWREIDARCDPQAAGGFHQHLVPSGPRGLDNYDATAIEGLDRYTAAIMGLTVPRNQRWHGLSTPDKDLNKLAAVQRWCEHATDRLFACRYAPAAGFEMQMAGDVRQGGKYGTAPFWIGEDVGRGLFYRALHLSEVYIDEDYRGRVDTVHRRFAYTVRQLRQMYGEAALTDRMMQCWTAENRARRDERFEVLHVIAPRADWQPGHPGDAGKRYLSLHIAIDEKAVLRRGGYRTMPVPVSRAVTSPGSKYGRSPAMKVIGTIRTANAIAKTILRAGHKAVDPALAFFDDGNISKLVTKPGGLNPGLVDEFARGLVQKVPGPDGTSAIFGDKIQEGERQVIRDAFLEQLFQILTNPSDRMTATQVLEMIQKQGVLVAPFAGRHEHEKLGPTIERELDVLLAAGQIDPMPPEMTEAGLDPVAVYENPLARMSRAEEAAGFSRWLEMAVSAAAFDEEILDYVDTDAAMPGLAEVLSVRPTWVRTPEQVAERRAARAESKQLAELTAAAQPASEAALNLARAREVGGLA